MVVFNVYVRNREQLTAAFHRLRSNDETLTELNLRDLRPSLTIVELTALTESLKVSTNLAHLDLHGCLEGIPLVSLRSILASLLSTHPSLKYLVLAGNNLTAEHAVSIAEAVKTNHSLTFLDLSDNHIGDEGCQAMFPALRVNKTLETLYLCNCNIGDNGCCVIASALEKSNLKVLHLGLNRIRNVGVDSLADGLVKNKSLNELILGNNEIDDCRSIARALCRNFTLCGLDLASNSITNDSGGVAALEASLKHVNYSLVGLDLSNNEVVTVDEQGHFGEVDGVSEEQQGRIDRLCENNSRIKRSFTQIKIDLPVLSLAVWPRALLHVIIKPDLIYAVLKSKPDLCRESVIVGRLRREVSELRTQVQNERQMRLAIESELARLRQEVAAAGTTTTTTDDDDDDDDTGD